MTTILSLQEMGAEVEQDAPLSTLSWHCGVTN
ncbi:class III lanthipeptide [Sphaerisporangium sp. B11E5]